MLSRCFHFEVFEIFVFSLFLLVVFAFWGGVDIQHFTIRKQILKKKIMSRYNHRIFPVFSFPKLLTVNCYLLSEPQIVFGNCQLSTVTLAIDIGFALMMSEMYDFYPYTMLGK